jgi:CHAT domain-containing protein
LTLDAKRVAQLKVYVSNLSRAELSRRVAAFRDLIEQRDERVNEAARELFDLLIAGASDQLRGKERLTIAPDSALWGLPFQALRSANDRYLIETAAIAYAPSLSAYREMKRPEVRRAPRERLLAFGDPVFDKEMLSRVAQLSGDENFNARTENENELKAMVGIYGASLSRVYAGADASEEKLKTETAQSRALQLSTRAVLSDANPLRSAALLTRSDKEDGLLQVWEIMGLNLMSDVVVMSDCETATAEASYGDSIAGLSWGWLIAGCPTVLINQLKADSEKADLLAEFHRNLKARILPSEALRRSALKMIGGERAHPFYWSPMIVIGRGW